MRFLGGLALLSVAIVACIVLLGSAKQGEHLFGTITAKTTNTSRTTLDRPGRNPIEQSRAMGFVQTAGDMLQGARLDFLSSNFNMTNAQLLKSFKNANSTRVYKRASLGRIVFKRLSESHIALCFGVREGDWQCLGQNLQGGALTPGYGVTYKQALRKVAAALR